MNNRKAKAIKKVVKHWKLPEGTYKEAKKRYKDSEGAMLEFLVEVSRATHPNKKDTTESLTRAIKLGLYSYQFG